MVCPGLVEGEVLGVGVVSRGVCEDPWVPKIKSLVYENCLLCKYCKYRTARILLHCLIHGFCSYLMNIQHLQANHSIEQQHSIRFQKDRFSHEEYLKHIDSTWYNPIHEHKIQMG